MDQSDINKLKDRERHFREKDLPFEIFTVKTKTKWWSLIEMHNVFSRLNLGENQPLLDIGCSDGRLLEYAFSKGARGLLIGIDFALNPLREICKKNIKASGICADISQLPFRESSFAGVTAVQVIQNIPHRSERTKVFKNIHNVLRPRGRFVLTVLNHTTWKHLIDGDRDGPLKGAKEVYVHLYTVDDLHSELKDCGFKVLSIQGINQLPVRYLRRLGIVGVWLDLFITQFLKSLSLRKAAYLIAICQKN